MLKKHTQKTTRELVKQFKFSQIHNSDGHSYYILKIILYDLGKNIWN